MAMATSINTTNNTDELLNEWLSRAERDALVSTLDSFVTQHAIWQQRPVALVSSGGTVAQLELHSVRCIDNFSTGLRGAISVEGLLKRGYAVIHLWRKGSASPFARVLTQHLLGPTASPHLALDSQAMARLFRDDQQETEALKQMLRDQDPWLTQISEPLEEQQDMFGKHNSYNSGRDRDRDRDLGLVCLSQTLTHSSLLKKTLRQQKLALRENRLLTVPFYTVEEYLAKLQLCAQAVHICQSLALIYLAAAVSDFYIPRDERAEHKIQSNKSVEDKPNKGELILHLKPVPKTIGLLRSNWAPKAFCVTFKLETDLSILRSKAEQAVETNGVHLVIANILETRHEKVWILSPETQTVQRPQNASNWTMQEIARPTNSQQSTIADYNCNNEDDDDDDDDLEELILDKVVESHFEYISFHMYGGGGSGNGSKSIEAARQAHDAIKEKKRRLQQQLLWKRVAAVGTELAGFVLSGLLSWAVAAAIQRARRSLQ